MSMLNRMNRLVRLVAVKAMYGLTIGLTSTSVWAAAGHTVGIPDVSDSGAAGYSIALRTPAGINGVQPSLSFVYSSRAGDGYYGMGWGLSGLSAISRCRKTWAQDGTGLGIKNSSADRFCLDGNQLRLTSGTYGSANAQYRTELDTVARITSYGVAGNGPAYFIVERKDGLIYEYGNTTDSRVLSVGQTTARGWFLNKVRDRAGNWMLFTYTQDSVNGGTYIANIQYTENDAAGVSTPHYKVAFTYENIPTGEVDNHYLGGSVIARKVRAKQIDVTNDGTLVYRYILTYETNLSTTSKSRLSSIQECAGTTPDCLGPTNFTYQSGTVGINAEVASPVTSMPSNALAMSLDVNGDGRQDLVYVSNATSGSGHWMVAFANASGGYNSPVDTGIVNTNYSGAVAIDYNADGLQDLLVPYSGGTWWVMLGTTSGFASPANTGIPTTATGTGSNARAIDVDGDGYEDLVWADLVGYAGGDVIHYRLRVPGGTFSNTVGTLVGPLGPDEKMTNVFGGNSYWSTRRKAPDFDGDGRGDVTYELVTRGFNDVSYTYHYNVNVVLSGGGGLTAPVGGLTIVYYGDFNGDGLDDILYGNGNSYTVVRYSTGTAFTSEVTVSTNTSYNGYAVVDWDGDGFDDVVLTSSTSGAADVARSTGTGFGTPTATGLPAPNSLSQSMIVTDLNGDGLADLAYGVGGTWKYRRHQGGFPDLLLSATDAFGNQVSFSYVPITQSNYGKGSGATFPEQDYQGPLYVVISLSRPTGIQTPATYSQTFSYTGARRNLQGRGFEGFLTRRMVDSRSGIITANSYNQSFPIIGTLSQTDIIQSGGTTLISRTLNTWASSSSGSGFQSYVIPYLSQATNTRYEVAGTYNGALLSTVVTNNSIDAATGTIYDSTTTTTEASSGNGVQPGAVYTQRRFLQTLFTDTTNWCVGRAQVDQSINSHSQYGGGSLTRQTNTTWDGATCRPSQIVAQLGDPNWQVTTGLGYDAFGNINAQSVTGAGMSTRSTSISWGTRGQFPESVTNAAAETSRATWDFNLGQPLTLTDPNNVSVSYVYDAFGRRTRQNRPDGTYIVSAHVDCASASGCLIGAHGLETDTYVYNADGTVQRAATSFLDLLDRPLLQNLQMLGNVFYRRDEVRYDSLGRIAQRAIPCTWSAVSTSCSNWITNTYDALNRVIRSDRPTSDTIPTAASTFTYYEGLTTHVVDPQSKQSKQVANVMGVIARTSDHDGYSINSDYDAFGDLVRTTDSLGNTLQTYAYNIQGMRVAASDADLGSWSFTPDALGELVSQTDANTHSTTFVYDSVGRLKQRTEPEGTSSWTWGTSAVNHNIGKLANSSADSGYSEAYTYDGVGRPLTRQVATDATYQFDFSYNTNTGLLDTLTYPTSTSSYRLKLQYGYQHGILNSVADFNTPATVYWQATTENVRGQVTAETLGNGVVTGRAFDSINGWLNSQQSGVGGGAALQNESYLYDAVGNVIQRQNNSAGLTENFYYDDLYRLHNSDLNGTQNLVVNYDAMGNILSRTDVAGNATWTYDAVRKHAVASVGSTNYNYDGNGNVASGNGYTVQWASFNHPNEIDASSGESVAFAYNQDHERWRAIYSGPSGTETTQYIGDPLEIVIGVGGARDYRHYIYAGPTKVAVYSRTTGGVNTLRYIREDHEGGVSAILTDTGTSYLKESFTPFGNRRSSCTWAGAETSGRVARATAVTRRGYTWQTMLGNLGLNDMHGRIQDAVTGRFLSPDPFIFHPELTQDYNRYSYVHNNPVTYTDPSGFETDVSPQNGCFGSGFCSSDNASAANFGGHGFHNSENWTSSAGAAYSGSGSQGSGQSGSGGGGGGGSTQSGGPSASQSYNDTQTVTVTGSRFPASWEYANVVANQGSADRDGARDLPEVTAKPHQTGNQSAPISPDLVVVTGTRPAPALFIGYPSIFFAPAGTDFAALREAGRNFAKNGGKIWQVGQFLGRKGLYNFQQVSAAQGLGYTFYQEAANFGVGVFMDGFYDGSFLGYAEMTGAGQVIGSGSANWSPSQMMQWQQWWTEGWSAAQRGNYPVPVGTPWQVTFH
ncbi:MAG: VCBS repeat-containing protein [Proteobacteria bacterium]|nr:VCBS repeat-containing protein [Pseudomonadota bacterium]